MFNLQTLAIGAAGMALLIGALVTYNIRENAEIRKEAVALEQAASERITMEAIDNVGTAAEQARIKLAYCRARGMRFDYGNPGSCY